MSGTLFVVSTPIGNLGDISERARQVLARVDLVAAEDTRHSGQLLAALDIKTRLVSCHDHNEASRAVGLVERMLAGESVALISDAGTPLVSDPGFRLVGACHEAGVPVVPVPGASALLAALAAAGLPTDRFCYEGFPPARGGARRAMLERVSAAPLTSVLFEAPHRMESLLDQLLTLAGPQRPAALCRELTKHYETILTGSLAEIRQRLRDDANQLRGEMVLVLGGAPEEAVATAELQRLAGLLAAELPASKAAKVLAAWSGRKRQEMYQLVEALE